MQMKHLDDTLLVVDLTGFFTAIWLTLAFSYVRKRPFACELWVLMLVMTCGFALVASIDYARAVGYNWDPLTYPAIRGLSFRLPIVICFGWMAYRFYHGSRK